MTSERMSEHLESALFANACGGCAGVDYGSESRPRQIVAHHWLQLLTDFADWSVSAGAGGGAARWV